MTSPASTRTSASASSSALESFLAQIVVDDYATVDAPPSPRSRPGRSVTVVTLVVIGLLIAVAAITTREDDAARQSTKQALAERIDARSASVTELQALVTERRAEVDALRDRLLDQAAATGLSEEADALAPGAGATELTGPGLTVTVDDAADATAGSLNQVLDRDLQDIVNALWQMGASGVAVNGQRLNSSSAIRGAGAAILVNYQPITRPYVITAMGTATSPGQQSPVEALLTALGSDYGLVSSVATGDVTLPAGDVRAPRFATIAAEEQAS